MLRSVCDRCRKGQLTYRNVGEQLEQQHDAGLHQPRGGGGPGHHGPPLHRGQPPEDNQAETPQFRPGREHRIAILRSSIRGTAEADRGGGEITTTVGLS